MADSDDDSGSADLSLKLRRGSSDSRDSFYMEFDQGIDSDIEAVEAAARTAAVGGVGAGQMRDDDLPPPPPSPPPPAPPEEDDDVLPPPPPMESTILERPYPSGVSVVQEEEEEDLEEGVEEGRGGGVIIPVELPDLPEVAEEDEDDEEEEDELTLTKTVITGELKDEEGNVLVALCLKDTDEDVLEEEEEEVAATVDEGGGGERDDEVGGVRVEEEKVEDVGEAEDLVKVEHLGDFEGVGGFGGGGEEVAIGGVGVVLVVGGTMDEDEDSSRGEYLLEGVLEVEESMEEVGDEDTTVAEILVVLREDEAGETEMEIDEVKEEVKEMVGVKDMEEGEDAKEMEAVKEMGGVTIVGVMDKEVVKETLGVNEMEEVKDTEGPKEIEGIREMEEVKEMGGVKIVGVMEKEGVKGMEAVKEIEGVKIVAVKEKEKVKEILDEVKVSLEEPREAMDLPDVVVDLAVEAEDIPSRGDAKVQKEDKGSVKVTVVKDETVRVPCGRVVERPLGKVKEEEEVKPGPSGSSHPLQLPRVPSPASSSSTTTTSSDSASTPRRQRPGWDTSIQTTDTEVAAAAAAAVALATGSPGNAPLLLPSPASPTAILVSPETLSPTRTTPTADLKSLQPPHSMMASAPPQQAPQQQQQQLPNGSGGLQRQAPTSLGIAPAQTGLMLYHPQMPPVPVQHHPHHVHHHPHHHHHHSLHHGASQHHAMPPAIKAVPESQPLQGQPPSHPHHPPASLAVQTPPTPPRTPAIVNPSIPPITALARIEPEPDNWKKKGTDALTAALSALYGKLLVVMGIAFPMAEVISTYIPPSFYEGFYLYLYIGSMGFLFYMYAMLLRDRATYSVMSSFKRARGISVSSDSGGNQTDTEGSSTTERSGNGQHYSHQSPPRHYKKHRHHQEEMHHHHQKYRSEQGMQPLQQGLSGSEVGSAEKGKAQKYRRQRRRRSSHQSQRTYHYGSFYLRMGAVAFGIGSMIYSGLEFGQYFELERDTKCHNVLLALTPATRMAFIFIQMYFIFLNNEMKVYKHKLLARFGLMHMIGTNLCVWLNVLVQETKHEILTFFNPENNTLGLHSHNRQHSLAVKFPGSTSTTSSALGSSSVLAVTGGQTAQALHHDHAPLSHQVHHRVERGLKGPHHIYECRRTNIMGSLVQDASPFLFPCTIEYSLICAAILYVMWKNISRVEMSRCGSSRIGKGVDFHGAGGVASGATGSSMVSSRGKVHITPKRSPHHYSVDCARAHKGLFVGILVLVLTIISLILFFVLIGRPELVGLAVFEVNMCELTLYALSTLATIAGMIRVRELRYDGGRNLELDSILLIVSQTGMFTYSTFTVIGGHFTLERNTALVLATALASLVQTTVQTIFVLDASRRSCATASQIRRKPGREVVTFLLVANLAMWAVNTLEKSRAESHPVQLHFYGLWAWTIITHVSMPLAIFYRFHSTVCLCEIWKRAYKMKPVYM